MATIHKLTKDGATIFPATITDAVVHPQTGKTLTSMIKDYNVSELFPTEGIDGGNKYNLALAIQVLGTHLSAAQKTGGIKLTFISSVSPYPTEEYYLGKSSWSGNATDWDQRFEVGDVVADPSGSWTPGTAEAYIDQQVGILNTNLTSEVIARQNGDANLRTQLQSEMATRADQDANLNALINAGIREGGGVQFDTVPTQNSANGITSGGIYSTLRDINVGFVDDEPTYGGNNLVNSNGIYQFSNNIINNALELFSVEGYINTSGKHYSGNTWKHTDFLEFNPNEDIILGNIYLGSGANIISFYSNNYESSYISGIVGDNSGYTKVLKSSIPNNSKYIRVCSNSSNFSIRSPFISIYNIHSLHSKIEIDISNSKQFSLNSSYFTIEGYISISTGEIMSYSLYRATNFIKINKNADIKVEKISCGTGARVLAFYDNNKNYISQGSITGTATTQTIQILSNDIPSNAFYIRCSGDSYSSVEITNGTIVDKIIKDEENLENEFSEFKTSTESLIESKVNEFVALGSNDLTFIDKYISINNGQLYDFADYNVSDYIFINREHNIIVKNADCPTGARVIAFYGQSKNYISEGSITGTGGTTNFNILKENIPINAVYFRVCSHKRNTNIQILNCELPNDLYRIQENLYNLNLLPPLRILILGDSYSAGGGYWVEPMMKLLPEGSTWISLAVGSAKIRDRYQDRETYPYTSRPVSSDDSGNLNNIACQIQKLKRLMAGTDLDEGETQLYTSPEQYPNVIIIEGGHNDWADADSVEATYNAQLCKTVSNVYIKSFPSSTATIGSACIKTPLDEINRTCYAGAYRYAMDELLQLFPNAQIYITTVSPISYRTSDPTGTRIKVAEQQRKCADLFNVSVIDWHRDGQINSIANYTRGSGTENDPYITAYQSGEYVDTNDQLHPNARGGRKYGRLAAHVIRNTYLNIE